MYLLLAFLKVYQPVEAPQRRKGRTILSEFKMNILNI
jgi:hypothetical protein